MFDRATIRLRIGPHSSLLGSAQHFKLAVHQILGARKHSISYRIVSYRSLIATQLSVYLFSK